ncbi:MAG: GlsB/YeaQ/YmgE family stress response membrane protein [Pseudomonadota bacterium]
MGLGFIASIIVGGLAGWVASSIMRADTGLLLNIGLGIAGAFVANVVFRFVGVSFAATWIGQGVARLVGACLLIFVFRAMRR